ncbi:hypothetical protein GW17_00040889 [Ensete ventricosum]|nr:hypothetical protein GW17_00040889 [Ensete ventricosum]
MHPLKFPNIGIRAKQLAAKVGTACGGGAATCMLSAYRGGWPRPTPLQGLPAMAWLPARGGHPRAWPAAASPATSWGGDAGRRGGCPLAGRLPAAKASRLLRRGSDDAVRVKEG